MSEGLIKVAAEAVDAFAENRKVKNRLSKTRRSESAEGFHRACVRFGHRRTRRAFLRSYMCSAANHFAAGARREGRHFYDGAFLFAGQEAVRKELLAACVKTARDAYRVGDHHAVWCLLGAVGQYPPAHMNSGSIYGAFSKEGIDWKKLGKPPAHIPSYVLA